MTLSDPTGSRPPKEPASPADGAPPPEQGSAARRELVQGLELREKPTLVDQIRVAPITFALIAVNVVVFLWAESHGGTTSIGVLLTFGASERLHVWSGEYWRLITPMFLHIGWPHLLWNAYASIGWCVDVERALGKRRFLAVYLASGIG